MIYTYFFIISLSIIGWGYFFSKLLNLKFFNFGYLGFLGLSCLIFISFATSLFIAHNQIFNLAIISFGIILFIPILFNYKKHKTEIILHSLITITLFLFILIGKNHDDFSYYHFPYTHIITQMSHPIGLGHINNGFRSPSSLFFLSSLFYLPKINFYLLHIAPAFFLGFSNHILIKFIFNKKLFQDSKFINLLSLICFIFINVFFYRLAEHGTDKSGQILVLIIFILIYFQIYLNNNNNNNYNYLDEFFFICILLSLLISIKSFYLIYVPILLIIFFNKNIFSKLKKIFFSLVFLYSVLFVSFVFLYSFLNSGCIVYPANFSCFDHLSWSFNEKLIIQVNQWYELWAKAGATPNYVVEDRATYISKFNWFPNWIDNYFFNKVSDFLLGISFLILIFYTFFRSKSKFERHKFQFNKYLFLYIFLILVFSEWFIKHPSLRYGGYQVIALLLFIPLCSYISKSNINFKDFKKKALVLLLITIVVFVSRNITRLVKENKLYKYNPIQNTNYNFNKELHLRYYNHLIKNKINYKYLNFFGKKFLITVAPK